MTVNPPKPEDSQVEITDNARGLMEIFLAARRADLARLDAALAAGDLATIAAVGHLFNGSSAPFGFPEAGRIGAELEAAAERGDREAIESLVPRLRASLPLADPGDAGPP